jgi:threonine 3-dehydrogenase
VNVDRENMIDAQRELNMREGFDVGLEMSGSSAALRDMITQMTHGGRIAVLGIPPSEISVDVATIVLKMLTIKGIYGREMFDTWYEMSVLLESGLDISGVITDRFHYTEYEKAFAVARSGHGGKVIMSWEG